MVALIATRRMTLVYVIGYPKLVDTRTGHAVRQALGFYRIRIECKISMGSSTAT